MICEQEYASQWIGTFTVAIAFCCVLFIVWSGEHVLARRKVSIAKHKHKESGNA